MSGKTADLDGDSKRPQGGKDPPGYGLWGVAGFLVSELRQAQDPPHYPGLLRGQDLSAHHPRAGKAPAEPADPEGPPAILYPSEKRRGVHPHPAVWRGAVRHHGAGVPRHLPFGAGQRGAYRDKPVCWLILPPAVAEVLREYQSREDSRWMVPSPVKEDAPLSPGAVRRRLQRILEHAGCKHVRFHDLRHLNVKPATQNSLYSKNPGPSCK